MSLTDSRTKSLILCATIRSGSTVIYEDLRATLGLRKRVGEILVKMLFRDEPRPRFSEAWPRVREENLAQTRVLQKVNFQQVASLSKAIATDEPGEIEPDIAFSPEKGEAFFRFFETSDWVHVWRRDVFAQTVSRYMAFQTGVWHALGNVEADRLGAYNAAAAYDRDALLAILRETHFEREQWGLFFAHFGVEPITLVYEDVIDRYPDYWLSLLGRFGLTAAETPLERRQIKLGNKTNAEFQARLMDDARALLAAGGEDAAWLERAFAS